MFDYFHDVRKDILTQNKGSLPLTMGIASDKASWGNGGEVTNRGYEATLEVFGHAGDFEYSVQGGIWYNHNIINKRRMRISTTSYAEVSLLDRQGP